MLIMSMFKKLVIRLILLAFSYNFLHFVEITFQQRVDLRSKLRLNLRLTKKLNTNSTKFQNSKLFLSNNKFKKVKFFEVRYLLSQVLFIFIKHYIFTNV